MNAMNECQRQVRGQNVREIFHQIAIKSIGSEISNHRWVDCELSYISPFSLIRFKHAKQIITL